MKRSVAMDGPEARRRFTAARVASLATTDTDGQPHVVPVVFVVDGDAIFTAVDAKPKRAGRLRRHTNITANPRVSLLAQHWDEDWSMLWWVRVDGRATVTEHPDTAERVVAALRAKYPQYREVEVGAPVIEVAIDTWRGWSAT